MQMLHVGQSAVQTPLDWSNDATCSNNAGGKGVSVEARPQKRSPIHHPLDHEQFQTAIPKQIALFSSKCAGRQTGADKTGNSRHNVGVLVQQGQCCGIARGEKGCQRIGTKRLDFGL